MNRSVTKMLPRLACGIFCLISTAIAFAQFNDWKGQKLQAKLKRKHPPEYFIIGTAVRLQVSSQISSGNHYVGLLKARLESGLFAQDSRLRSEERNPQTIISCEITRIDADDNRWEQRTTTERQKTGERQEWNQKKGKYDTKDVYTDVRVTRRYRIVKGGINISYQTRDARTRETLDSQNIPASFGNEYLEGNGALSDHEVIEMLVNSAVEQIVRRLTPTTELLTVNLPRGKVEDFSKLGQAGLWEKMREGVEKMGILPKLSDEAYRQFGLGISNEALAYQQEKLEDSIKLFEEATINYNKALELKPDEKYFRDPLARLEQSLAQYKKLASQQVIYARSQLPPKSPEQSGLSGSKGEINAQITPPRQSQKTPAPKGPPALTNRKVIEMVAVGVDVADIITTINEAPVVQFDFSADAVMDLSRSNVPKSVSDAMRLKQKRQSAAPRRSTSSTRKKTTP